MPLRNASPRRVPGASAPADPALRETADRLHSAAIHLLRGLRKVDDASGLSAPRLSALSVLVFAGPRTLGELAAAEQVRPPTMTRLVQALERDGLVTRTDDPVDRRVVQLRATAAGRRVLDAGRRRRIAALEHSLAELEPADRELLGRAAELLEVVARASSRPTR